MLTIGNELRDQVALVTGASSGIGRAIALALAAKGAEVCLVARRRHALEEVARQIGADGGQNHMFCADLTNEKELIQLGQQVSETIGRLDILVLCGATICHGTVEQSSAEELDVQYQTNLRGNYVLIQTFLPDLRKHRGQIVFINSSLGTRSDATVAPFCATQYALRALADGLRAEINRDGVRVLSVFPGRTATPRIAALCEAQGRPYQPHLLMQAEDVAALIAFTLALPRTVEVTDINMRSMLKSY